MPNGSGMTLKEFQSGIETGRYRCGSGTDEVIYAWGLNRVADDSRSLAPRSSKMSNVVLRGRNRRGCYAPVLAYAKAATDPYSPECVETPISLTL